MSSPSLTLPDKKGLISSLSPETIHVSAVIVAGLAVIVPMILWGIPSALDLSNHFRFALPFYDGLRSGHLYPGWLAESNHGFGDPSFRFYPPALYYLLSAARALSGNWYVATVATFAALSMLGAFGMYLWAREYTTSATAMWAGVFFAFAPYHVNQLYQALLLAEFAGTAVLPFVFLFTERVCRHRRGRDVAGLAGAYGLLVLTHLPLTVVASIALALFAVLRIERQRFWRTMGALSVSVAIGLAASASYWVTMVSELAWIRAENTNQELGLDYRDNFVLSSFAAEHVNVWWMNILLLSMVAMFWPALTLVKRSVRDRLCAGDERRPLVTAATAAGVILLFTLFMATPLSRPIWNGFHLLQQTQFPWRWFAVTSLAGPLLLAMSIPFWTGVVKTRRRPLVILACGTIAISLAFSLGHIIREARWLTPNQFTQLLSSIPGSESVEQWNPIWVHGKAIMNSQAEAGGRNITIQNWSAEKRVFHVDAGNAAEARVRTFFYPHWTATANNHVLLTGPDYNGVLSVSLPREAVDVSVEFREPRRARYAAVLMAIGWILIAILSYRSSPVRP